MGAKKSWVTFIAAMSLLLTACSQESGASAAESNAGITEEVIETMEAETFRVSQEISLPGASGGERIGEPITVRLAGDFCLAEGFAITEALDRRGDIRECFSDDLLKLMSDADLFMLNNEFTYSDRGTPTEGKDWTFRAGPERVSVLNTLGVDIAGLANNHAYDWGEDALLDTVSTLQNAGIVTVGAGKNLEEARKPAYFTLQGRTISVVAATAVEKVGDREYGMTKAATADSAGVFSTIDPADCVDTIREAKANSDFVFVYVHWGTEMTTEIDADQKDLAKAYIDAGADAVVGNHPHVLQGFEYYNGKPILYSLGNFWFNSKDRETCVLEFAIDPETMEAQMKFLPCLQSDCYTKLITEESEKCRMIREMTEISFGGVSIDENGIVTEGEG